MGRRKLTNPHTFSSGQTPKQPYSESGWNETKSENYDGMDAYYSEYRRDSLTRNSINALAYFSTTKGFEAVVDLVNPADMNEDQLMNELKKYSDFQDYVNTQNKLVNLDNILNIAIIKMKIYGQTGFEFVLGEKGEVVQFLPRRTERSNKEYTEGLDPIQDNSSGDLKGFGYRFSNDVVFEPNEIFWLVNNGLEHDFTGISDIEPVFHQLSTRRFITNNAFKEITKRLWCPYIVLKVDTGRATETAALKMLNEISGNIKPGLPLVVNQDIEAQVLDQNPAVDKLVAVLEAIDTDIIGNFRVPRFLLGREKQFNRATAFAEGALFLQGPIADIQKYVAREVERQWYSKLVKQFYKSDKDILNKIKVKHQWNPITMNDWIEQVDAYVKMFSSGIVNRSTTLDALGFDSAQILKDEQNSPETAAQASILTYDVEDSIGNSYRVKKTVSNNKKGK